MAVIAYASANPAPITNPDDDLILYLASVTLPQTNTLYGDAYDSNDPGNAAWNWSWTILDNDTGTPATLSSDVVASPDLTVNVWRNVLLFLVVQNANTLEFSETDPLKAPDSAFVQARVLEANHGLQKGAAGARNWLPEYHAIVEAAAQAAGGAVPAHTITDHTDVTSATGAELEILRGGSYAESGGSPLHLHKGAHVDVAGVGSLGVVELEEAPVTAGAPKVITQERLALTQGAEVSYTATGAVVGIVPHNYPSEDLIASGAPLLMWRLEEALELKGYAVRLRNGGPSAPTSSYIFALVRATAANAATQTWTTISNLPALSGAPSADDKPLLLNGVPTATVNIPAGEILALLCLRAPKTTESDWYGGGLSCDLYTRRKI